MNSVRIFTNESFRMYQLQLSEISLKYLFLVSDQYKSFDTNVLVLFYLLLLLI